MIKLSLPMIRDGMPLNEALHRRRSVRAFHSTSLDRRQVGQLLWSAQGKTSAEGYRTAPSAGATYPLEIYLLDAGGVYRYDPTEHSIEELATEDRRLRLQRAALNQSCVGAAAVSFVVSGVLSRTSSKYGARAHRYVAMEAGSAYQNLLLEAAALDLGAVVIGAFEDDRVSEIASLRPESVPLAIVCVGQL